MYISKQGQTIQNELAPNLKEDYYATISGCQYKRVNLRD